MTTLTREIATGWIERWDRQQEEFLPDREERFTALIDAVAIAAGRPDPLVLDLGCGPGSLAVRLLDQIPEATVIAIDADPLALGLGREAYGDRAGLHFVSLDLRTPGWSSQLGLNQPADAAVSTTALHWIHEEALRESYAELLSVLRPGGLLLNGDNFTVDSPTLARLDRAIIDREYQRRFPDGHGETWGQWWKAVAEDQALAELYAEHVERWKGYSHSGAESGGLRTHLSALEAAGFGEVGTLWQRGDSRLLCAVA